MSIKEKRPRQGGCTRQDDDDGIALIRIKSRGKFVIVCNLSAKLIRIFDENHPSNCATDYALCLYPPPSPFIHPPPFTATIKGVIHNKYRTLIFGGGCAVEVDGVEAEEPNDKDEEKEEDDDDDEGTSPVYNKSWIHLHQTPTTLRQSAHPVTETQEVLLPLQVTHFPSSPPPLRLILLVVCHVSCRMRLNCKFESVSLLNTSFTEE